MACGDAALGMPLSFVERNLMCFPCATSCPVLVLLRSTLMVAIKPPTLTTCTSMQKHVQVIYAHGV